MEYYSTIERNGVLVPITTQMDLKIIILSERSVTKSKYCMIPFNENLLKSKLTYSDKKKISDCLRMGEKGMKKRHKRGWETGYPHAKQ